MLARPPKAPSAIETYQSGTTRKYREEMRVSPVSSSNSQTEALNQ